MKPFVCWISVIRGGPFFLYLAYGAEHSPLQAPDELVRKYDFIEDRNRRIYAAMVEAMDIGIERVLKKLEEQEQRKKTLVIYFNDNGGARWC